MLLQDQVASHSYNLCTDFEVHYGEVDDPAEKMPGGKLEVKAKMHVIRLMLKGAASRQLFSSNKLHFDALSS